MPLYKEFFVFFYDIIILVFFKVFMKEFTMEKITAEYITLQQFMKLSGIVSTGGEAKLKIKEMDIVVNGEKENRRGRKLYPGDKVKIEGKTYVVF